MRGPTMLRLLLALGVLLPGAPPGTRVMLAAPAQADAFQAYLPTVLVGVPAGLRQSVASGTAWHLWPFTPTDETVIGTLTVVPDHDRLDGVIAFFDGEEGALERALVRLRFNPEGGIDALDGSRYRAVEHLRYQKGTTYDFRIVVDLPHRSFDAYVTPAGGAPVLVARDFALDVTAAPFDRVSQLGIRSSVGSFEVLRLTIEHLSAYSRVTSKTPYAWFPNASNADAVVNASPTPGEGFYGTAAIHPDGRDMIFAGAAWGYSRIWRYTFATDQITALTPPTYVAVEPAYSADGRSIVFTSDKGLGAPRFDMFEVGRSRPHDDGFKGGYSRATNLYVMDADGTKLRRLTTGDDHVDMRGSFSPDGETVVFLSSRGASTLYLWTVPADGSAPPVKVALAGDPWVGRPVYAVDGQAIFFFTGITDGAFDPLGRHTLSRALVGQATWSTLPNDTVGIGSHGPAPDPSGARLWYHAFVDGLWSVYTLPLSGGTPTRFVPPGFEALHIAHATEASNGTVAFDSRSYLGMYLHRRSVTSPLRAPQ